MPSNKGGSLNGGIIGKSNKTSFGKDKLSVLTSSSPSAVTTQPGTRFINYAVVAGGGGGGTGKASPGSNGGGGGAGGLRSFENVAVCGNTALGAVTIGAGGANSTDGNDTSFVFDGVTYTADSGGAGGDLPGVAGSDGGSGGGGAGGGSITAGGSGNTPPTNPPQGNPGGTRQAGGGGALGAGTGNPGSPSPSVSPSGVGAGIPTAFGSNGTPCGSFRYYASGGAGRFTSSPTVPTNQGGGGTGGNSGSSNDGTANTGGGGGGDGSSGAAGVGGSGIVIIRYKFQ